MHGLLQVAAIETVVSETDIFASPTDNFNIITLDHLDNEIDFGGSEVLEGVKVDSIKPLNLFASSPLAPVSG